MDKEQFASTLTEADQELLERGSRFAAAGELDTFIREVLGEQPPAMNTAAKPRQES